MIGLLGRKVGMTQIFDGEGHKTPVTLIQIGPCVILRVKKKDKDGYDAVQLGFADKDAKRTSKPFAGQFKKAGVGPKRFVREIRTDELEGLEIGRELNVDQFEVGEFVDVEGISIGKGFQGVVKRHHFAGGPKSHGSMFGRVAGSIGASSFPSRVVKGMRMPGQLGNQRATVQNLKVMKVDSENNLLAVKGAVPGTEDGCLVVRTAIKRGKTKKWKVEKAEKPEKAEKQESAQPEAPPSVAPPSDAKPEKKEPLNP